MSAGANHRGCHGSADGVDWQPLPTPDSPLPSEFVAVGPDRMIAMGMSATVLHSRDGRAWSDLREGVGAYILGVAWLGDRFVAVNRDGLVFCSRDGLTWGKARLDLKGLGLKRVREVDGELFGTGYGGLMIRSKNGVEWEHVPVAARDALNDIARGGGTYVAVGDKGLIMLSEDGREWRLRRQAGAGDFQAVVFGSKTFVALSRGALWSAVEPGR